MARQIIQFKTDEVVEFTNSRTLHITWILLRGSNSVADAKSRWDYSAGIWATVETANIQ